jgi:hypothetical protein
MRGEGRSAQNDESWKGYRETPTKARVHTKNARNHCLSGGAYETAFIGCYKKIDSTRKDDSTKRESNT